MRSGSLGDQVPSRKASICRIIEVSLVAVGLMVVGPGATLVLSADCAMRIGWARGRRTQADLEDRQTGARWKSRLDLDQPPFGLEVFDVGTFASRAIAAESELRQRDNERNGNSHGQ